MINIAKTIFLCVVLAISSMGFSKDSQTYILDPMERMMEKIKIIAANPMSAATEEVGIAGVYSFEDTDMKKKEVIQRKKSLRRSGLSNDAIELLED